MQRTIFNVVKLSFLNIKKKLEMVFMKHYAPNFNFTYTELVCKQILHNGCKVMLSITKYAMYKGPNLQRVITQSIFFGIYWKDNSGHLLITFNPFINIQGSSFNSFWDILLTRFLSFFFFSKSHNSEKGHNPDEKKKICVSYFSWQIHI